MCCSLNNKYTFKTMRQNIAIIRETSHLIELAVLLFKNTVALSTAVLLCFASLFWKFI